MQRWVGIRDGARESCPRASPARGLPAGICRAGQQNSRTGQAAGARSIHGRVTGAREKPSEATRATFILMTLLITCLTHFLQLSFHCSQCAKHVRHQKYGFPSKFCCKQCILWARVDIFISRAARGRAGTLHVRPAGRPFDRIF